MMEEQSRLTAFGWTRRRLLRFAGIGAVAVGAGSILSYGDSSTEQRAGRFNDDLPSAIGDEEPKGRIVYSTHDPETITAVLKRYLRAFPDEHIQLVNLGSQDAVRRVTVERAEPLGDVLIHAHAVDLIDLATQGILQPHRPELVGSLPERHRDEQGRWYAVGLRPQVLAYNRRVLEQAGVRRPDSVLGLAERTWRANALGEWRGEAVIGLPDPLQPSTLAWLASIFVALGKDEATKFVNNIFAQGACIPGGPVELLAAIRDESYAIGPVEAPAALRVIHRHPDSNLDFAYVEQDPRSALPGAWASPTAVALLKDTRQAHQLMDFLLSPEAAASFAEDGFEFPVRSDVPLPAALQAPEGGLRTAPLSVRDILPATEDARQALRAWLG